MRDQELASTIKGCDGRRPRTVYAITPKGRRELAVWVAEPGEGPVLEFDQLMKTFFAENGSTVDLASTLNEVRAWANERTLVNIEVVRSYLEGRAAFPERIDIINQLVGRFLDEPLETVDGWAEWAERVAEQWPNRPADAEVDRPELEVTLHRSLERAARWRAAGVRPTGERSTPH